MVKRRARSERWSERSSRSIKRSGPSNRSLRRARQLRRARHRTIERAQTHKATSLSAPKDIQKKRNSKKP
jgi:hypothetical protein